MNPRKVVIDKLVLKGINPANKHLMTEAMKKEISRVLQQSQGQSDLSSMPVLKAGRVVIKPGQSPSHIGAQVGRQVAKKLNQ